MSDTRIPSFVAIAHDFPRHPKLVRLGKREQRMIWVELLCYASEYRTGGFIPNEIGSIVPGARRPFLERAETVGLLHVAEGGYRINDWDEFNGSKRDRLLARERKRKQREREAQGSQNSHAEVTENVTTEGTKKRPSRAV